MTLFTATPRRPVVPAGLAGMLALIVGVELWLQSHPSLSTPAELWDCRTSVRAACTSARGCDSLVLGDSLVKLSVLPSVISRRTGRPAYNLGISGSQPPTGYFLVRRALESGARPSAILVGYSTRALQLAPRFSVEQWALLGWRDCVEVAWSARDPELAASLLLRRTLTSLHGRQAVRHGVLYALRGQFDPQHRVLPKFVRNWERNNGAQMMAGNPALRTFALDVDRFVDAWYSRRPLHPAQRDYLERLFRLAADHGIRVYWVQTPTIPSLQAGCERSGFHDEWTRFLGELLRRHPNLSVVDGRLAAYDPAVFMDPNHLGRDGAYIFSSELADLVFNRTAATDASRRWLTLPGYRPLPVDPRLEQIMLDSPVMVASPGESRLR